MTIGLEPSSKNVGIKLSSVGNSQLVMTKMNQGHRTLVNFSSIKILSLFKMNGMQQV
jgi:hypothetical protein